VGSLVPLEDDDEDDDCCCDDDDDEEVEASTGLFFLRGSGFLFFFSLETWDESFLRVFVRLREASISDDDDDDVVVVLVEGVWLLLEEDEEVEGV